MYRANVTVKMHDTDAAGIIFFGNQFKMAHDVYEQFLKHIGHDFADMLRTKDFFVPIVHAEACYKKPLFVGDELDIQLSIEKLGTTSFIVFYQFRDAQGQHVGDVRTVHVAIDKGTRRKRPVPEDLRAALSPFVVSGGSHI